MRYLVTLLFLPVLLFGQGHLLISEVYVPASGVQNHAFVEIYNPTNAAIATDNLYLANYKTYYEVVNDQFSTQSDAFLVQFPSGTIASKQTVTVALYGSDYKSQYGNSATYEIGSQDDSAADMTVHYKGANIKLSSSKGMLILFNWDGSNDLVQDVDYAGWGTFTTGLMDKTNIQIDGKDVDSNTSAYKADIAPASQKKLKIPTGEKSLQRAGIVETDEIASGGNGVGGHNEASEDLASSFLEGAPSPGTFSEIPGDGTGNVTASLQSVVGGEENDITFSFSTSINYTITKIELTIPSGWSWGEASGDVVLSGTAFTSAQIAVNGSVITISDVALTTLANGTVQVKKLTAPTDSKQGLFTTKTAVAGGNLTAISNTPVITITNFITIAEARNLPSGTAAEIKGVIVIGAGVLRNDFTSAYIADETGGIQVYKPGSIDPDVVRGSEVIMSGEIDEFNGVKQFSNYTITVLNQNVDLPKAKELSTKEASDASHEGAFLKLVGRIEDKYTAGPGVNIELNDGSGAVVVRVWETSNVDLNNFNQNDFVNIIGIHSLYNGAGQVLLAYNADIDTVKFDDAPIDLEVPNKPFAPDQHESFDIKYSAGMENSHVTMRIYDLGGRLIRTLFDGTGSPIKTTISWDGRNEYGDLATIGAYILHFEITNEETGKRQEKVAPIVVGTILSR